MIVVDANETNVRSRLPNLSSEVVQLQNLEELTGADMLVTMFGAPVTEKTIPLHIQNGAVLIQRKSGRDLISSIVDDRILRSLAKMRTVTDNSAQCLLMYTGDFQVSGAGLVIVDGKVTDMPYLSMISAVAHWNDRGGVSIHLLSDNMIPDFLIAREKHLAEYVSHPVKNVNGRPLQELVFINDWRTTMATFPLIGMDRATKLHEKMRTLGRENTLLMALMILTSLRQNPGIQGIGRVLQQSARAWLGLPDGFDLDITYFDPFEDDKVDQGEET